MVDVLSQTSTNAANLHLYYEKRLLKTLEKRIVLQPLGMKQRIPKGMGGFTSDSRMKWLRYDRIDESTSSLTEGTRPDFIGFTTRNIYAQLAQYGQAAQVTDVLVDTAIDPVMKNLTDKFGRAAARTIEALIVAELDAEAARQLADGAADTNSVSGVMDHLEPIKAMISQKRAFVNEHESGSFVCVLNPASEYDMLVETGEGGYLDIRKYDKAGDLLSGEVGRMYGIRFVVSDLMSSIDSGDADPNGGADATLASVNLFNNYVIGEEAFGVVELDGRSVQLIHKKRGSAGTADPLDQLETVGYKIHGFAAKALKYSGESGWNRVIRIVAASAA